MYRLSGALTKKSADGGIVDYFSFNTKIDSLADGVSKFPQILEKYAEDGWIEGTYNCVKFISDKDGKIWLKETSDVTFAKNSVVNRLVTGVDVTSIQVNNTQSDFGKYETLEMRKALLVDDSDPQEKADMFDQMFGECTVFNFKRPPGARRILMCNPDPKHGHWTEAICQKIKEEE